MQRSRAGELILVALVAICAAPVPALQGQVRIKSGRDGGLLIFNEPKSGKIVQAVERRAPVRWMSELEVAVLVERYSARHRLDPKLVAAVIEAESDYDPGALSRKGAMGLMQLMPVTARAMDVSDPWDPEQNVRGGTAYLRRLLDRFGRLELALAAYNAGPTAVERHGGVPPYRETRAYVAQVLRLYRGEEEIEREAVRPPPAPRPRKLFFVRKPGQRPKLTTELP